MTTFDNLTLPGFDPLASGESTPCAEGSHARTSARRARVPAWTVSDPDSGESTRAYLASFDRESRSWRTSVLCGLEDLPEFSQTLPRSGSMLNGTLYLLPPLVRLTSVIASGSSLSLPTPTRGLGNRGAAGAWKPPHGTGMNLRAAVELLPTPTATSYGSNQGGGAGRVGPVRHSLQGMAQRGLLPTPTAQDSQPAGGAACIAKGNRGHSLTSAARLLPTPTSSDANGSGSRNTATSNAHAGVSLTDWAREDGGTGRLLPTPQAQDHRNCADYSDGSRGHSPQLRHLGSGRLNPRFVEWMMGLPPGWTDVDGLDEPDARS